MTTLETHRLQTPAPARPVGPDPAADAVCPKLTFEHAGQVRTLNKHPSVQAALRKSELTIAQAAGKPWYLRLEIQGRVKLFSLSAKDADAIRAAKDILRGRQQHPSEFSAWLASRERQPKACTLTLADIEAAYLEFTPAPPKVLAAQTRTANVNAMRNLLRRAGLPADDPAQILLTSLGSDTVYAFKQAVIAATAELEPEERTRKCLSANSILLQARSLFSDEAQVYYTRTKHLTLPDNLARFRSEPGFTGVRKENYHAPSDSVIHATIAALQRYHCPVKVAQPLDQNMFVACWLAIGFGLRKNEISRSVASDFQSLGQDIIWRPAWYAKNKTRLPEVRVQLDAWLHLGRIIRALPADAPVLIGNETERNEDVFRRISAWMRGLGWETTHHIHELRAWAGSRIADESARDGLRATQIFLRHASYNTTEQYYGHHRKVQLEKIALKFAK